MAGCRWVRERPELLAEHFPSAAATGAAWYIGADGSRGDALRLAAQIDAQLVGHDRGLRLLHAGFDRIYQAYQPGWAVLVNALGHRFADETAPYGIMDYLVRRQGDRGYSYAKCVAFGRLAGMSSAVAARQQEAS